MPAALLLEPSLTSGSQDFWGFSIPRLTTSLSQRCFNLCLPSLCGDSPLHRVDVAILCNDEDVHSGCDAREDDPGCSAPAWHGFPANPRGKSCLISTSAEILKTSERKHKAVALWLVTANEEFQSGRTALAPEFTSVPPEDAAWTEGARGPLCVQCGSLCYNLCVVALGSAAPAARAPGWVGTTSEGS